jgi:hypothetical protein
LISSLIFTETAYSLADAVRPTTFDIYSYIDIIFSQKKCV